MAHRHVPHSTKWFEALIRTDPERAAHLARIVALSGRDDVCGDCGDEPASDYEALGESMSDGSTPTMRFCSDCMDIRRGMGERWKPIVW